MSKRSGQLGTAQVAVIGLTVATALIHLYLAFQFPASPDPVFTLNGLGYLGLLALLYWPLPQLTPYRHWIRWVLIGYTALTLVLWLFIGAGSPLTDTPPSPIAYLDKVIELVLLVLLWRSAQTGE